MDTRPFVHLHCHTHYSLLDGASRVPELVQHVKSLGMNSVAITDHGNLYGALEFYRECKAAGVNPIVGYEAYVAPGKRSEKAARRGDAGYHLTLLAYNRTGFQNLVKMSSLAFLEGYSYVARIDKDLLAEHADGLICLSGCASSEFSEYILREKWKEAEDLAGWFAKVFGKHFYVEIQNNGLRIQRQCAEGAIRVANKLGLPLVATCDAHYLTQADAAAHDVLLCINTGAKRSDPKRMRYGEDGSTQMVDQFYVQSPQDIYGRFPGHEDAVRRSQEIADGCDIQLDLKKRHFPVFSPPEGLTPEAYLRLLCEEGLKDRYGDSPSDKVRARLEHELGIICRMGFASYFLIVWDFVRFARETGIPASARGSGCGAMVAYVLYLSHVCPLEYDLLFERFLDPNRAEAPDIDIDFCQNRREEVIAYVKRKYGEGSVAQIATFGTLAAKAAIKDVGRVLDIPLDRVNAMSKHIPDKPLGLSIEDSLNLSKDFRREYELDPVVTEWIDIAKALEGTNRNSGTHAAGVVIANGPILNYVPVHVVKRKGEEAGSKTGEAVVTTQWVMGDIEKAGMLKMDFLGLRTLTVLDGTVRLIKKTRGIDIDVYKLPLDDKPTYELLQRGDAKGVFQFESEGIRELLKRMKPDNIRDIIACTALYRPGPLEGGLVDEYVDCKHGRKQPTYAHPVIEEVLNQTYGVMVYQEDIMRILNRLGGIELSSAYACIKAISKKKQEIIDQRKADFIRGAKERGLTEDQAKEIFDLIVCFAGYGFNKSHSAAYAVVSYQTAYLKRHYTPEFMAALLSSEIDDGNKRDILVEHIQDARKMGVSVRGPNVNEGEADFTVRDGQIVFGLLAVKGVGRPAVEEIARVRNEKGRFRDLYDLCERVDLKVCGKSALEKLIKAGALDCFSTNRQALWIALPRAIQTAEELQSDRRRGQGSLFDEPALAATGGPAEAPPLAAIEDWEPMERLKFEKEVLNFYFSSHPLAQFERDIKLYAPHTSEIADRLEAGTEVLLGGMLSGVRYFNTKTARNGNSRYARFNLLDFAGEVECVMWPDDYVKGKDLIGDDAILFVKGTIERKEKTLIVANRVFDIETARKEMTKGVVLVFRLGEHSPATVEAVSRVLRRAPGKCPVWLDVRDGGGKHAKFRTGDGFRVDPNELAVSELEVLLGPGGVFFTGR